MDVDERLGVLQQQFMYVPMITNYTSHWWVPNVVVAHLKEGIEAVHLATGRTVCKVLIALIGCTLIAITPTQIELFELPYF